MLALHVFVWSGGIDRLERHLKRQLSRVGRLWFLVD